MEYECICGRTYVTEHGAVLCPICIAEETTGKPIAAITDEEYEAALVVFKTEHKKMGDLFNSIQARKNSTRLP